MVDIKNVLILGAGTLGSRIGLQAAISNYQVTVYDIHESALLQSKKVMEKVLRYAVKIELIDDIHQTINFIFERIKLINNYDFFFF